MSPLWMERCQVPLWRSTKVTLWSSMSPTTLNTKSPYTGTFVIKTMYHIYKVKLFSSSTWSDINLGCVFFEQAWDLPVSDKLGRWPGAHHAVPLEHWKLPSVWVHSDWAEWDIFLACPWHLVEGHRVWSLHCSSCCYPIIRRCCCRIFPPFRETKLLSS